MTTIISAEALARQHFPNLADYLEGSDLPGARRVLDLSLLADSFDKKGIDSVDVSVSAISGRHRILEVRDSEGDEVRLPELDELFLCGLLDTAAPIQCADLVSELFNITVSEDGLYRTIELDAGVAPSILGEAAVGKSILLGALDEGWTDTI